MNETKGNAEIVLAEALAPIISLVAHLANLLIKKDVITKSEMTSLVERFIAGGATGDHAEMSRSILQSVLKIIEQGKSSQ
jgi:hypothetical protein